jgi:predicted enzyme related to lactoylglutathione lyase
MTTDTKSAGEFYSKIVGWKSKPWAEDGSYTLLQMDGRQMAGLMATQSPGAPPSWLTYIGTPSVDESVKQATALGAKVHKAPSDIPTIGRFAILEDPLGAVFAVFTPLPGQQPPPDAAPGLGDFSWHELATTDWRAALTFYQRLFGWEETSAMDMGPGMGTYQMFGWKGQPAGGIFNKPAEMPGPAAWLPYIRVTDAKGAAKTIKRLGGKVINGPMEVPGGDWITAGIDLQGGMFAVHAVSAPAAVPAAKGRTTARRAVRKTAAKKATSRTASRKKSASRKRAGGRAKGRTPKTARAAKSSGKARKQAMRSRPMKKKSSRKRR